MDIRKLLKSCALALLTVFFGCSKSNEADLQSEAGMVCDTTNTSFSSEIAPVLQDNCNFCHSTASALAGIVTDNYNSVKTLANKGPLLGTITHDASYVPMPLGRSKLSNCDINKIRAWINAGTPNN